MSLSFNGPSKLITLSVGTTVLGVRDLYSRWVDWWLTGDNSKFSQAFATVGGDDIDPSSGTFVPIYAFLLNGWKIRPQEADHTLVVNDGILLVAGGGDPFVNTVGSHVVRINYQQPVQAITVSTTGGGSGGGNNQPPATIDASGLMDIEIEQDMTLKQAIRVLLAVAAGKTVGTGGDFLVFRDMNDTKNRVTFTLDDVGNREFVSRNTS